MRWRKKKRDFYNSFNVEVGKQSKMDIENRMFHFQLFVLFIPV